MKWAPFLSRRVRAVTWLVVGPRAPIAAGSRLDGQKQCEYGSKTVSSQASQCTARPEKTLSCPRAGHLRHFLSLHNTMQWRYNTVVFTQITQNRQPRARPWGRDMRYLLWVPIIFHISWIPIITVVFAQFSVILHSFITPLRAGEMG